MVTVACPRCKTLMEKVSGPMICPNCGYGGQASNVPPPPPPPTQASWAPAGPSVSPMTSNPSGAQYPADLTSQLGSGEQVHFFSYLATKGGCFGLGGKRDEYWIALTSQRIIYRAMVKEQKQTIERDGMVPFVKVSHVEVAQVSQSGCMGGKSFALKIGSSGGEVQIPITSREKGLEIRNAYARLAHHGQ